MDIVGGLLAAWQQQRHFDDATRLVKQNEPVELAPNARRSSERAYTNVANAAGSTRPKPCAIYLSIVRLVLPNPVAVRWSCCPSDERRTTHGSDASLWRVS